ncbi:MAG: enoyl-[acyl-carrier-protein] reductase FabL [Anaerolineales bacterium]|nr:enoyl-[acyl-carrier-protein] reductase FabL [Anaerolineales bacterium]
MAYPQTFKDKIALVTGSSRGIGRAIALHFAQRGADVVINYARKKSKAEETAAEVRTLGRRALVVKANVGELADIERLFAEIESEYGGLDIFVSNAASGFNHPTMEQTPKGWDWTLNINARSYLFAAQQAVPLMEKRGGGYIVGMTSAGSQFVLPDYIVVGASKAAIETLTRYMAVDLAPKNISVNAVSPGVVATDALQYFDITSDEAILEQIANTLPAKRLVSVEDVAEVVAFLCSPAAEMIRGQVIVVDGGHSLLIGGWSPNNE